MKEMLDSAEKINQLLYRYDRHAEYFKTLHDIGKEQIEFYKEQGYLAIESFLNRDEIEGAVQGLMDIVFNHKPGISRGYAKVYSSEKTTQEIENSVLGNLERVENVNKRAVSPHVQIVKKDEEIKTLEELELAARKVSNFVEFDSRLKAIAFHPTLLQAVEKILGEKPKLVQDMALLKPPHGGGEKPWHQDMAYRGLDYERPVVGVWIALDEADTENGCMHIVPRSHMDGGIPHYAVRDWQICDDNVTVHKDTVVPLKPGGVLFFHGMLHHGTPTNFSVKKRRALQFHYAPESAELVTPKEYKRMFTNEMSGAKC